MKNYLNSYYWNNLPVKNPVQNRYIRFQKKFGEPIKTIYDKISMGIEQKLGEFPEHRYSRFFKEATK